MQDVNNTGNKKRNGRVADTWNSVYYLLNDSVNLKLHFFKA